MRVVSRFRPFDRFVKAHLAQNLDMAAERWRDGIREDIGIQGPPRSLAGMAPHIDTKALWESETYQTDRRSLRARIMSDDVAAFYLEVGTVKMAPRPYRLEAIIARRSEVGRLLFRPL